ncbi:MAG: DUF1566 domain-containing protein [Treponema sp.]|jgi:hypothetical protein|nr:DUF1566 domain-containing protein [Treponema sp.]
MKKRYSTLCAFIALIMMACQALDSGNLVGPAGGFVFYDKGNYSAGWRYLECAPKNVGTGTWERAKQLCENYSHGGYDDWRLPDIDELEELLDDVHGWSMLNVGVYWSSTTESNSFAWGIQNGDSPTPKGNSYSNGNVQTPATYRKNGEYWVRPVRSF